MKPNSQATAQNFEKRILQKCLRIHFCTYISVNPLHFIKKHHNHCTLLYMFPMLPLGGRGSAWMPQQTMVVMGGLSITRQWLITASRRYLHFFIFEPLLRCCKYFFRLWIHLRRAVIQNYGCGSSSFTNSCAIWCWSSSFFNAIKIII